MAAGTRPNLDSTSVRLHPRHLMVAAFQSRTSEYGRRMSDTTTGTQPCNNNEWEWNHWYTKIEITETQNWNGIGGTQDWIVMELLVPF